MTTPSIIPPWLKAVAIALALAAFGGVLWGGYSAYNAQLAGRYSAGYAAGKSEFERLHSQAASSAREQQIKKAETDMATAAKDGAAHEQRRTAVDAQFDHLDNQLATAHSQGARNASSNPARCSVDDAVLSAERLRIWRAANSGRADHPAAPASAPAGQSHSSPAPAPAAGGRADQHAGAQSPGDHPRVSPAGDANLWTAPAPARGATRLQPVADDIYRGS